MLRTDGGREAAVAHLGRRKPCGRASLPLVLNEASGATPRRWIGPI